MKTICTSCIIIVVSTSLTAQNLSVNAPNNNTPAIEIWDGTPNEVFYMTVTDLGDLTFSANNINNELFRLTDDNGFLGLGTNNPSAQLQVHTSGNNGIHLQGDNTGDVRYSLNNFNGAHYFFDDMSEAGNLGIESANEMKFNVGGPNTVMRLINSSSNQANADGPVNIGSSLSLPHLSLDDNGVQAKGSNPSTFANLFLNFWGGDVSIGQGIFYADRSTSRAAVGTTTPDAKLEVKFVGNDGILINGNNTGDARLSIENGGGTHYIFDDDDDGHALDIESANDIVFNVNGPTERVRLIDSDNSSSTADGPVNFGALNGAHLTFDLNEVQSKGNSPSSFNNFYINHWGGDVSIGNDVIFMDRSTRRVGIDEDSPGVKFQVGSIGDGSTAEANAWNTFSDRRYKKELMPLSNTLDNITELTGYYYYHAQGDDHSRQIGVIAQELELVYPELVNTNDIGYKSVDYGKMTAILLEAVKELKAELNDLKKECHALKAQLEVESN
ncbi:MAG: tail fiber domain-containing protein [Saprospiraceae bacterium]|nr:tail fiber domain-containing protein [Saprospiraceae bacterium]